MNINVKPSSIVLIPFNQNLIVKEIGVVKKESMGSVLNQLCKKVAFYYGKDFVDAR